MEKVIEGWLIVDVGNGKMRTTKKYPRGRNLKASEVAIEIKLDVDVPDKPLHRAEGKITLSSTQLNNMIISQIADDTNKPE